MKTNKLRIILAAAVAAILITLAWFVFLYGVEDTDNAQIAAHVAILSAKVPGFVTDVYVEENQKVKKGQILVKLDKRDFVNSENQLEAELSALTARLTQAEKDLQRALSLFSQKAISTQERDNAQSNADELRAKVNSVKAKIAESKLNMEYSEIVAPADGTIGKKSVEPGMVMSVGQPLMAFVDSRQPWIIANFKETQLRKMHVGDKAHLEIDSIDGKTFEGEVESLSPGTGATFALIPPDNATGNFTKIVQRLPVRIKFNSESIRGYEDRIVPGLSVEAKVHLR